MNATITAGNKNRLSLTLLLVIGCIACMSLVGVIDAKSVLGGRVPGTKWCGPGNDAANETDFGENEHLDRCCYNHDRCEIRPLKKGTARDGLNNTSDYTKSHCICDKKFHDCLTGLDGTLGALVGRTYFRVTSKCFMEYYPILKCRDKKTYKK